MYSRNAMDNASKNARDMIDRLTMQYNRGRQAAITNELVDIITGTFSDHSSPNDYSNSPVYHRCKRAIGGEERYG
jgi:hypothetical protein